MTSHNLGTPCADDECLRQQNHPLTRSFHVARKKTDEILMIRLGKNECSGDSNFVE